MVPGLPPFLYVVLCVIELVAVLAIIAAATRVTAMDNLPRLAVLSSSTAGR